MSRTATFAIVVLCLVAIAATWFDGVERAIDAGMVDFNILYGGAKLFGEGVNPYFSAPMQEILGQGVQNKLGVQSTLPGVFGVLYPVGLLEHRTASYLWLLLNVMGVVASLYFLLKLTNLPAFSPYGFLLITCCLLVGAYRMGIRQGQLDNMLLAMTLLSCWLFWLSRFGILATLLMAIAVTLKPTSTGLFAVYFLGRGKPVEAITTLLMSALIIAVCVVVLTQNVPEWWLVWADIRESVESDYNRVTIGNPRPELLTHLPIGLFAALKSAVWANIITYLVCGTVLLRTLLSVPTQEFSSRREHFLRELSIVALVSLLIVYHRFYSAVYLVLPIALSIYLISENRSTRWCWPIVVLIPLVTFVNGQAAVNWLFERNYLSGSSWFEQVVIQYHFVWFQLALLLVLFSEQLKTTRFSMSVVPLSFQLLMNRAIPGNGGSSKKLLRISTADWLER